MKALELLRYWLWDRWHGTSVSAFDERRAVQEEAPVIEIGGIRVPKSVLIGALTILLVLGLLALILALGRISFVSNGALSDPTLQSTGTCFAEDNTGRTYVALDCLGGQMLRWLSAQVSGLVILMVGVIIGWFLRGFYEKRKEGLNG